MHILLIDNSSLTINQLYRLLNSSKLVSEVTVMPYGSLTDQHVHDQVFDAYVLSGGSAHAVQFDHSVFQAEIDLLLTTDRPVLGICAGAQLVAYAYGAKLQELAHKRKDLLEINICSESDPIFQDIPHLAVREAHRWAISDVKPPLELLADSVDGAEVIKHQQKLIYGFQFHPELLPDKTAGDEMLANFLRLAECF